jgi:hypothetical protein
MPTTFGLAIWRSDEYILNLLFAIRLQFQPRNKAKQLNNNELLFINSAAVTADDFQIPPHRQAITVVRHFMT